MQRAVNDAELKRSQWASELWTSSDDRVRGGKSQSYLEVDSEDRFKAIFRGDLDIKTLGGAGFASQRTVDDKHWDLSAYDGISLKLGTSDEKKYTLILKDGALPKRPDGREQSTVSWEYDFVDKDTEILVGWKDFKPTYRGKPKPDAEPLNLKRVQRMSIMMRRLDQTPLGPCGHNMLELPLTVFKFLWQPRGCFSPRAHSHSGRQQFDKGCRDPLPSLQLRGQGDREPCDSLR